MGRHSGNQCSSIGRCGVSDYEQRNQELLEAHDQRDAEALIRIYKREGEAALADGKTHEGCFLLTHAYVFALEAGAKEASEIHKILVSYGREE